MPDLIHRETRRDVLWTVPVKCLDVQDHRPLGLCLVSGHRQFLDYLRSVFCILDFNAQENLKTSLIRVVHQEKGCFIIYAQISNANVLQVAAKISIAKRAVVQNLQKPCWATAKLNVGLTVLADGRHVKPIPGFNKVVLRVRQPVKIRLAPFKPGVVSPRSVTVLRRLNARCECQIVKFV